MKTARVSSVRIFHEFRRCFHANSTLKQRLGVIGIPFSKGQSKQGVENGPAVLRSTEFIEELRTLGHSVQDYGDVDPSIVEEHCIVGVVKNCAAVSYANKKLSESVKRILKEKETCIVLGGDHSIALGSIHGHSQVHPDLCLLWIDAHADINTATTTNSGHMHGMSASFHFRTLEKYNHALKELRWLKPCLDGKDAAYIGLRDVEPLESLILKKLGIKYFSMEDVDRLGIDETIAQALDSINPAGNKSLHVSYDIDSLDPVVAPSTGTAVAGGLTLREGLRIAEEIHKCGNLHVLDLVEVNPMLGTAIEIKKTLFAAKQIVTTAFGSSRAGNIPMSLSEIPEVSSVKC